MKFNTSTKRAVALATVAVLTAMAVLPHILLSPYARTCANGKEATHEWTGLKLHWTDIPTTESGDILRWPRKTYFDGGNGEYAGMDNSYCFCVANHTGQANEGDEAFLLEGAGALLVQDYEKFKGNEGVNYGANKDIMRKFTFCLAAAAANYPGQRSDQELKSGIEGTYMYAMVTSVFLAIEGRLQTNPLDASTKIVILTPDKEAARAAYHQAMEQEFFLYPHQNQNHNNDVQEINPTIKQQLLANRDAFFDTIWDAAWIMCDAIKTNGTDVAANRLNCVQDSSNPMNYIVTIDCHGQESLWTKYYSKLKAISPSGCTQVSSQFDPASSMGTIIFQVPGGNTEGPKFQFEDSAYLTDLSQPVLYQFNFCSPDEKLDGNFQTLFCAMHKVPIFEADPSDPPPPPPSEGRIELEIHRYRHTETWQTTYNVDLIKFDSETGKPLEGSQWDVLEYDTLGQWDDAGTQLGKTYLDHPLSEAENIGTKYNWANDNGTQFTRWEGEDACERDLNVTGEDGYLYEANSLGHIAGTKAHADEYNYTYTKGYCTGHPKPVIQYYECEHDEEDDCDCEEKNAELDRIAEEAWKEQVEYCDQLAKEGGFFHTAEEAISETAKKELEADRDQFYKDYISLTYDYSAREIAAREGYIRHGLHTDDIPVERVVIHSSEFLDEIAGGGSFGSGSGSGDIDPDDEELTDPDEEEGLDPETGQPAGDTLETAEDEELAIPAEDTLKRSALEKNLVRSALHGEPAKSEGTVDGTESGADQAGTQEAVKEGAPAAGIGDKEDRESAMTEADSQADGQEAESESSQEGQGDPDRKSVV